MNLQEIEAFAAKLKEKYYAKWVESVGTDYDALYAQQRATDLISAAQDLQEIETEEQK